ncbi:hypothetical protein TWF281_007530 [Arthrobotrys megalospora]
MKFFTVLALAVLPLAFASPIEVPEALQQRACNYNAASACSSGCASLASSSCAKQCKGATSPSCEAQCYTAKLNNCKNCCAATCTRC